MLLHIPLALLKDGKYCMFTGVEDRVVFTVSLIVFFTLDKICFSSSVCFDFCATRCSCDVVYDAIFNLISLIHVLVVYTEKRTHTKITFFFLCQNFL